MSNYGAGLAPELLPVPATCRLHALCQIWNLEQRRRREIRIMRLPIWVWMEFKEVPRFIALNLLALRHYAGDSFEVKLLNRSTLGDHLELPAEFERIPYAVAASDFARIGLMATRGGLYLDADFLVAQPLAPLRELLQQYDIVSYTDSARLGNVDPHATAVGCKGGFAPNFVAARPNSALWSEGWRSLREQLKRRCGPPARHKICCFSQNRTPVPCRVPWSLTDRVVQPIFSRMRSATAAAPTKGSSKRGGSRSGGGPPAAAAPPADKMYCFAGTQGFTPWAEGLKCTRQFHIHSVKMRRAGVHPSLLGEHPEPHSRARTRHARGRGPSAFGVHPRASPRARLLLTRCARQARTRRAGRTRASSPTRPHSACQATSCRKRSWRATPATRGATTAAWAPTRVAPTAQTSCAGGSGTRASPASA